MAGSPKTLFEKVWETHVVAEPANEPALIYIDLHLIHEVTSPQAFEGLRLAGRKVRRPDRAVALNTASAVLVAGIVDLIILRLRQNLWRFPSGAVLTAIIVTMVVRAQEPWYVPAATSAVAVLSKNAIRTRSA